MAQVALELDVRGKVRCPFGEFVEHPTEGPSVICGALVEANEREPVSAEVNPLVSGRTSGPTIACFCAGQADPGPPRPDRFEQSGLSQQDANRAFSFTDCSVFQDEHARLERVKREGQAARFRASGVERYDHDGAPEEYELPTDADVAGVLERTMTNGKGR